MCEKCKHEQKRESWGRFVYHERRLPSIRVKNHLGVGQFSMKDDLAAARDALESNRPSEPANRVLVITPGGVVDDEEANWGSDNLPAGPSGGGEQR